MEITFDMLFKPSTDIVLQEDEYWGQTENRVGEKYKAPFCQKCKTTRYWASPDGKLYRQLCHCQSEAKKEEMRVQSEERNRERFLLRQRNSYMDERYLTATFRNSEVNEGNKSVYEKCQKYVDISQDMFTNNIGMYVFGEYGSGKTHLIACVCNELVKQGWDCVFTSVSKVLEQLKDGDDTLLERVQECDFAFIDDLGKEFLAREYNKKSDKWTESKLFDMINARYIANKPTIFTSNYSPKDLQATLNIDRGIVERILEMSSVTHEMKHCPIRKTNVAGKRQIARELGVL